MGTTVLRACIEKMDAEYEGIEYLQQTRSFVKK